MLSGQGFSLVILVRIKICPKGNNMVNPFKANLSVEIHDCMFMKADYRKTMVAGSLFEGLKCRRKNLSSALN